MKFIYLILFALSISACSTAPRDKTGHEQLLRPLAPLVLRDGAEPFRCNLENEIFWISTSETAKSLFAEAEELAETEGIKLSQKIAAYEKALQHYHPHALERILDLYKHANKNGQYEPEVIRTYRQMIEYQLPVAYYHLFDLKRSNNQILLQNKEQAFQYLLEASDQGNPLAQLELANYYFYTVGDYKKGLDAARCALSQGETGAYQTMAVAVEIFEGNYPKMMELHARAAELGYTKSLLLLRSVFRDGLYGYERDQDLVACFDRYISGVTSDARVLRTLSMSCPLPPHPDQGTGTEVREKPQPGVEAKFNPQKLRDERIKEARENLERAANQRSNPAQTSDEAEAERVLRRSNSRF